MHRFQFGVVWHRQIGKHLVFLWNPLVWGFWRWPQRKYLGDGRWRWKAGPFDGKAGPFTRREFDTNGRRRHGW